MTMLVALATSPYAAMAPASQYLTPANAEIVLARSAAAPSISANATVMVLEADGYHTAVHGTNDFTCLVLRSWNAAADDPNFWNQHIRGPACFNAAATRTYLPIVYLRAKMFLAGKTADETFAAETAAFNSGKLPTLEAGAMCYMTSKQQYLDDQAKNWHPHVMFFVPIREAKDWGANLPGSPVFSADIIPDRLTIMMVPVRRWSDGTRDTK
jgi:hypothetical protein